jgi:hypothetical protein
VPLLDALSVGDIPGAFAVVEDSLTHLGHPSVLAAQITALLRDLLVLRAGGTLSVEGPALDARRALATRLEAERILGALRLLWDLKTRTRPSEDPRGSLDVAVALVGEIFMRGKQATIPAQRPMVQEVPVVEHTAVQSAPEVEEPKQSEPQRLSLADLK